MDIKAVCAIVFEDKHKSRFDNARGRVQVNLSLERWNTLKDTLLERHVIRIQTQVWADKQYALDGMDTTVDERQVYDETQLYLLSDNTTPAEAIRQALVMLEDSNPVYQLEAQLLDEGKLVTKAMLAEAQA